MIQLTISSRNGKVPWIGLTKCFKKHLPLTWCGSFLLARKVKHTGILIQEKDHRKGYTMHLEIMTLGLLTEIEAVNTLSALIDYKTYTRVFLSGFRLLKRIKIVKDSNSLNSIYEKKIY